MNETVKLRLIETRRTLLEIRKTLSMIDDASKIEKCIDDTLQAIAKAEKCIDDTLWELQYGV